MLFTRRRRDMKVQGDRERASWPASLANLTVEFIQSNLDKMLPSAGHAHPQDTLAYFDRNEISVGNQLGKGAFSSVYEIKSFRSESSSTRQSWNTANQMIIRSYYHENAAEEHTGNGRYVMKHLKHSLMTTPKEFQMAAVDLAVEAHFLSSFRHPHIVKLRGMAGDGIEAYRLGRHDGYFLIFDRLEETLEQQLEKWRHDMQPDEPLSVMVERMKLHKSGREHGGFLEPLKYASQIASALSYLHERDIMYRDLKPSNCGIDRNGDIQLFDFGFARQLPSSVVRDVDDTFQMTGRIGTMRYMSPEVALEEKYNLKTDVYSWSVLFWEILSLEVPYRSLARERFLTEVCRQGKRHRVDSSWPKAIQELIQQCWADQISTRPTMDEVCSILECFQTRNDEPPRTTRERTPSVVLELPPSFDIEKREPKNNGTVSTTTSATRESSTTVTQQRFKI